MTEEIGPHPLSVRVDELKGKLRLLTSSGSLHNVPGSFDDRTGQEINRAVQNREAFGTVYTDLAWVEAMQNAGVDDLTIAELWDMKDEQIRQMREGNRKPGP